MRDETNPKPGTKKRRNYRKEKQARAREPLLREQRIKKQHDITLGRLSRTGYRRGSHLHRIAESILRATAVAHLDSGVGYKQAFEDATSRTLERARGRIDIAAVDEMLDLLRRTNCKVHQEMRTPKSPNERRGARRLTQAA